MTDGKGSLFLIGPGRSHGSVKGIFNSPRSVSKPGKAVAPPSRVAGPVLGRRGLSDRLRRHHLEGRQRKGGIFKNALPAQ